MKKAVKQKHKEWRISICYSGHGIVGAFDEALEKIASRKKGEATGSGIALVGKGARDIDFVFRKEANADQFVVEAEELSKKWKIKIEQSKHEEERE